MIRIEQVRGLKEFLAERKPIKVLFGFGDVSVRSLTSLESGKWIESIVVSVVEAFGSQATLAIGTIDQPESWIASDKVDLFEPGDYQFFVNQEVSVGVEAIAYLNTQGSATGRGFVYFYLR